MGIYSQVQDTLDNAIALVPGIPELALENYYYEPKLLTPWARTTLLPTEASAVTMGSHGYDVFPGLYQVDLFYPIKKGTTISNQIVDNIVDYFDDNPILKNGDQCVRILATWRTPSIQNQDWFQIPVTLRFEAYY